MSRNLWLIFLWTIFSNKYLIDNFYRKELKRTDCVLCGKLKKQTVAATYANDQDREILCHCRSVNKCHNCLEDIQRRHRPNLFGIKPPYMCPIHGQYRQYQDYLITFKNWCIIWVTLAIIPLGLIIFESGIDLNWIFYVGAIITIPCFPPVMLSIIWVKATSKGLMVGKFSNFHLRLFASWPLVRLHLQ